MSMVGSSLVIVTALVSSAVTAAAASIIIRIFSKEGPSRARHVANR